MNMLETELSELSQQELIDRILRLEAHNKQLKNIISKKTEKKELGGAKGFNFINVNKLHIHLRLLYLGWNYQGFVVQEDSSETIEHHLFKALLRCRLIESRETSNYHRCGRTDKGVSSFGQVISITVRASDEGKPPLNYVKMLNRLLPEDIRAVSWRPVSSDFSARFNCSSRSYKYFFPLGNLDVKAMNEAAKHLVGTHDFRNLCKMDVGNGVTNFVREVKSAGFSTENVENLKGYAMCIFELTGKAFLWHQVRCIMSIMFLVGQRLESPDIVRDLLNVESHPRKPQYPMASPLGLNLFHCDYDDAPAWVFDQEEVCRLIGDLQKLWTEHQIKSSHIRSALSELESICSEEVFGQTSGLLRKESKLYKPLLSRHTCCSLEERIEHYSKKRKYDKDNI